VSLAGAQQAVGPAGVMLLALLLAACISDWKRRKIPNLLVVLGIVLGLLAAAAGLSGLSLVSAVLGTLVGTGLFLPLYLLRMVGAGDAKLMGMVGSFLGPLAVCWAALYTLVCGGLLAVVMLLVFGGWRATWLRLAGLFQALVSRMAGAPVQVVDTQTPLRLPYAIAIACGVLVWLVYGAIR
jgi:prepilin peptidase CpaA